MSTSSLTNPHRKISSGVRSGDVTVHMIYGDLLPNHLPRNCSSKNVVVVLLLLLLLLGFYDTF